MNDPTTNEPPVAVAKGLAWEDAWLAAGALQSAGIAADVYPPNYNSAYGQGLHRFDVLVRRSDLSEARAILTSIADAT